MVIDLTDNGKMLKGASKRRHPEQEANRIHFYSVYGLVIASEEPIQSLAPAPQDVAPSISVSFEPDGTSLRAPKLTLPPHHWIAHAVLPDGGLYLSAPDIFDVEVSADGRHARCCLAPGVDRRTVEANLLNIVIGTALTLQGEEPLHATAIDLGGVAVALLGSSGAGKSSLAAHLLSRGGDLVTDDMLRLKFDDQQVLALPGPYRLKLLDEPARIYFPTASADGLFNALSGKMMIRPGAVDRRESHGVPLAALYFLGDLPGQAPVEEVEAIALYGLDRVRVLLASAMDDRNTSPSRLARQMAFVSELSSKLPLFHLRYPRRFEVMDRVAAEIARTLPA